VTKASRRVGFNTLLPQLQGAFHLQLRMQLESSLWATAKVLPDLLAASLRSLAKPNKIGVKLVRMRDDV
jgi:hypothetical protein